MHKIRIGTSGWAYASWKPEFYPPKTPAAKFLEFYASRLNCVEVNYTFRAHPTEKMLRNWIDATPKDFVFVTKANQRITHIKRLKDVEEELNSFYGSLQPLRDAGKLGPVLFQLPPYLKADTALLSEFLDRLPRDERAAVEFRHASWFTDDIFELLRMHNAALCIAESDDLQVPEVFTASFAYYRLRRSNYSEDELKEVQSRITKAASQHDIFAFMKHEETPEGALNAQRLLDSFAQK